MSECPCVELRATNPTPTLTECAPCVSLRCPDDQLTQDQRTDLWNTLQCATAECPDHTGQVERCVNAGAFGTTLFNVTQEQIDDAQAALNAAALAEAQRLANAALNCPPAEFENTLQSYNPCGAGYDLNFTDIPINAEGLYMENGVAYAAAGFYTGPNQAAADAAALAAATQFGNDHFLDLNCCNCATSGLATALADIHSWAAQPGGEPIATEVTFPSGMRIQMDGANGSYHSVPGDCSTAACDGFCPLTANRVKMTFVFTTVVGTVKIYVNSVVDPDLTVTSTGTYEVTITDAQCGYNLFWSVCPSGGGSVDGTITISLVPP